MKRYAKSDAGSAISTRIVEYLKGNCGTLGGFEQLVAASNALPVAIDLITVYFISPNGDVYACHATDDRPSLIQIEGWSQRMATYSLALPRFPEVSAFIPKRQATDPVCPSCCGTGKFSHDGKLLYDGKIICPECGSLGWVLLPTQ